MDSSTPATTTTVPASRWAALLPTDILNRISGYFMPPGFTADPNERRQARVVVNTVLLTSLFSLNFLGLSWWADFRPGIYILLVNAVCYLMLPFGFRKKLFSHVTMGYMYLVYAYFVVFLNCIYQGGFYSATTCWVVAPAVVAVFMVGRRGGLIFFGLSVVGVVILWKLHQRGVVLPNTVSAEKIQFWHLDILLGVMLILFLVSLVFDHLNATTLHLVSEKSDLLEVRTQQVEQSMAHLKETQQLLIHSEKMASLGELTAGVAHEIQNPLNFVNNFAELSVELLQELAAEQARAATARDPGLEEELLADLVQNLTKIAHHGRRADSIVKGMLAHSRSSPGERHPTDVAKLADEYLRLSYHGLRAKDKSFNADFAAEATPGLPPVPAQAQELGRVLLNLCNNAFYAVQQRGKAGETGYAPRVTVQTARAADGKHLEIRVADNGTGMPAAVQAKIFQPFFTTKPSGEGTGLGLSLSYDIITKGHGGTLTVESTEGQGTTFVVCLPLA